MDNMRLLSKLCPVYPGRGNWSRHQVLWIWLHPHPDTLTAAKFLHFAENYFPLGCSSFALLSLWQIFFLSGPQRKGIVRVYTLFHLTIKDISGCRSGALPGSDFSAALWSPAYALIPNQISWAPCCPAGFEIICPWKLCLFFFAARRCCQLQKAHRVLLVLRRSPASTSWPNKHFFIDLVFAGDSERLPKPNRPGHTASPNRYRNFTQCCLPFSGTLNVK